MCELDKSIKEWKLSDDEIKRVMTNRVFAETTRLELSTLVFPNRGLLKKLLNAILGEFDTITLIACDACDDQLGWLNDNHFKLQIGDMYVTVSVTSTRNDYRITIHYAAVGVPHNLSAAAYKLVFTGVHYYKSELLKLSSPRKELIRRAKLAGVSKAKYIKIYTEGYEAGHIDSQLQFARMNKPEGDVL